MRLRAGLKDAGELLQIPLIDHIIVTDNDHFSFADNRWPKSKIQDFLKLDCSACIVIYYHKKLLAVSVADYGEEIGVIHSKVVRDGKNYFLAELGVKSGKEFILIPETLERSNVIECEKIIANDGD